MYSTLSNRPLHRSTKSPLVAERSRSVGLFLILLFFTACSSDETVLGSISFTANADCDIRLFDVGGDQIARGNYVVGKDPFIVVMKNSGMFVVHAVFNGSGTAPKNTTFKQTMTYISYDVEYFIKFE